MSDIIQPSSFVRRVLFTPLGDLVRGRVTGRSDARARIDDAALPPATRLLVKRVVRRTRLWRSEKVDVAAELVAHFADGLDAGATADELIAAFGDERQAARLIGRAKRRARPLAWQALRFVRRLAAVLVVVYAVVAVRFFIGRPRVTVDYIARLNASAEQAPADQRAWPLYREALVRLDVPAIGDRAKASAPDAETRRRDDFFNRLEARPGGKRWDELRGWLDAHAADVELIRQGAAKPSLGFVLGPGGSQGEWPPMINLAPEASIRSIRSISLIEVLRIEVRQPTPHRQQALAKVLAADLRLAGLQKDGGRLVRNLEALLSMAEQSRGQSLLASLADAIGIDALALDELDQTLASAPHVLSDAALVRVAHRLAEAEARSSLISLADERMIFHDLVQRTFTDDGQGDGRLTPDGVDFLMRATGLSARGPDELWPRVPLVAAGPLGVVASRRHQSSEYHRLLDAAAAQLARPAREADWTPFESRMWEIHSSPVEMTKYLPISLMMPSWSGLQRYAERSRGHRDGVIAAIALEMSRRRTGSYPPTLDALVPALLPAVPADRITGAAIRYKLVDGKPVVYSVGVDRDDDGGRVPLVVKVKFAHAKLDKAEPDPYGAAIWPAGAYGPPGESRPAPVPDGDWVLYPVPPKAEVAGE